MSAFVDQEVAKTEELANKLLKAGLELQPEKQAVEPKRALPPPNGAPAKPQLTLPLSKLSDLLKKEQKPIEWLVEDLIPAEGASGIVSKPKIGKSTLARQLVGAVAGGHRFLGKKTKKGLAIFVSLEEAEAAVIDHFRAMGTVNTDDILIFAGISMPDILKQLLAAIEQHRPVLVVLDTIFRFTKVPDANDYAKVLNAFTPVLDAAHKFKCCILALIHASKMDRTGGDEILGSTAILGSMDTALILKRRDNARTIYSVQRYGENLEETVLLFDLATRTISLGGNKHEADLDEIGEEIVQFLSGRNPIPEEEIREGVEGRHSLKVKALRRLLEQKRVLRQGEGKRNAPFHYFLPPAEKTEAQAADSDSGTQVPYEYKEPAEPEMETADKSRDDKVYSGSSFFGDETGSLENTKSETEDDIPW